MDWKNFFGDNGELLPGIEVGPFRFSLPPGVIAPTSGPLPNKAVTTLRPLNGAGIMVITIRLDGLIPTRDGDLYKALHDMDAPHPMDMVLLGLKPTLDGRTVIAKGIPRLEPAFTINQGRPKATIVHGTRGSVTFVTPPQSEGDYRAYVDGQGPAWIIPGKPTNDPFDWGPPSRKIEYATVKQLLTRMIELSQRELGRYPNMPPWLDKLRQEYLKRKLAPLAKARGEEYFEGFLEEMLSKKITRKEFIPPGEVEF